MFGCRSRPERKRVELENFFFNGRCGVTVYRKEGTRRHSKSDCDQNGIASKVVSLQSEKQLWVLP